MGERRRHAQPANQAGGLVRPEPGQREAAQDALAAPPGDLVNEGGRRLFGAVGQDQQQRKTAHPVDEVRQPVEGGAVGPVRVVDENHERPGIQRQKHLHECLEDPPPLLFGRERGGARQVR